LIPMTIPTSVEPCMLFWKSYHENKLYAEMNTDTYRSDYLNSELLPGRN